MSPARKTAVWTGAAALGILAAALCGAWWLSQHGRRPSTAFGTVPASASTAIADGTAGSTVTILTDPVKVFQQAFWRRPAADDVILHAVRREWSTETDGVRKWQWFLAVKTGPALKEWLAANPFSLADISSPGGTVLPAADFSSIPDWFPGNADGGRVQKHRATSLTVFFSMDGQTVYAADTGGGFTPPRISP